jgi:uncharacterized membrane protein YeaQ/YmgE (transglycosylase-associated protein family)
MDFGAFIVGIVVGMVVGGLAEWVAPDGGYGRRADVLLGVVGSGAASVANWIAGATPDAGVIVAAMVGVAGAGVVIAAQRKIAPAPLVAPRKAGGRLRP